jgi:peptide deformylase
MRDAAALREWWPQGGRRVDLRGMAEAGEIRTDERLDVEREARRALAMAQIRQYPDPVLRMRANEVQSFDSDLQALARRMIDLLHDANGVGLAANQVGVLRRVFVIHPAEDEEATIVVNPRLMAHGEPEAEDEGCLSLQGVLVPVARPLAVTLEGLTVEGEPLGRELEGLAARAAQHELDHLDGVLIVDRTTAEARREAMATLRPKPVAIGGS